MRAAGFTTVILIALASAAGAEQTEVDVGPRIVDKSEIVLVGAVAGAPSVADMDIAALWTRFTRASEGLANVVEGAGYELHVQTPSEPCMHYCLAGVEVSESGPLPDDLFVKVLPACTYAVFTHRVVDGYAKIYGEINMWLESSDYEEAHSFDFQYYDSRFTSMDDPDSVQDIYVPVRLK